MISCEIAGSLVDWINVENSSPVTDLRCDQRRIFGTHQRSNKGEKQQVWPIDI